MSGIPTSENQELEFRDYRYEVQGNKGFIILLNRIFNFLKRIDYKLLCLIHNLVTYLR